MMNQLLRLLTQRLAFHAVWVGFAVGSAGVTAQEVQPPVPAGVSDPQRSNQPSEPEETASSGGEASPQLRFQFTGATWEEVLKWFAEQADLSLQIDRAPAGTVNFVDPDQTYTVSDGLDLLNRLLLDRGWTLVRRGRMLMLIDLEVENADKLISEVAELVRPEALDERAESDIVKTVFPLGSLAPEDAEQELAQMVGPWGRVIVLQSARQVVVTETVGKLKAIRELLDSATLADGNVVEIELQHRAADEILELARPLLGLEPGESFNDEIRISVGLYGDRLFATGQPAQLRLLEGIVQKADTPLPEVDSAASGEVASPVLATHSVAHADSNTVFDVLQTLLAGTPDARIAIDPKTQAIVASARPETQELIEQTIAELESNGSEFEVIDLQQLAPSQALLTINKFFGIGEEGGSGPIVDGDPVTGRLWVRGTRGEIETVKKLISQLEQQNSTGGLGEKVRVLPYRGRTADDVVDQIEALWPMTGRSNEVRSVTPSRSGPGRSGIPERRAGRPRDGAQSAERSRPPSPHDATNPAPEMTSAAREKSVTAGETTTAAIQREPDGDTPLQLVSEQRDDTSERLGTSPARDGAATAQLGTDAPFEEARPGNRRTNASSDGESRGEGTDIMIQKTPSGLVVASQDTEALDALESLLSAVADSSGAPGNLPTIYWLKYVKAEVASRLVSNVLSGVSSGGSSISDSFAEQVGGGMLSFGGDEAGSSARSVQTSSGSVNIVADSRLNALIVQASATDLQLIDLILEKLDVQESPEDIETNAKPLLIPVIYQDAGEVAELVKEVFKDKIEGENNQDRGGDRSDRPSPRDFMAAMRGGRRGGGDRDGGREEGNQSSAASEPSRISVAVDQRSNSLVVTATPQDFQDVRELVELLDQQGMQSEESVQVVTLGGRINPDIVQQALETVLGSQVASTTGDSSSSRSSSNTRDNDRDSGEQREGPSLEEVRERIERFRAMRGRRGDSGGRGGFRGRGGRGDRGRGDR